ncbi:SET and MYND domain-containing protein 4 [Condylostylus longicornis]|uniref:SET and MYND domain-containing protein 4 n=1 Tax=Condylostylus longicornis TaxID=2530218 RepID=UPI00244DE070|nr:SET and MYND domain-containing protein 4 [Condylostylus longicornis]
MKLTEKPGFFPEYYQNIKNVVDDEIIKKFSIFENDFERVSYIENLKNVRDNDLKLQRTFHGKNLSQSMDYKEKGNLAFKNQRWIEALTLYSKSLIVAPKEDKNHLAILFANRSASLFHMERYDETLLDIHRSVELGYPRDMIHKILEREAQCYLSKKNFLNAMTSFKKTISALDDSKLSLEKRQKIEKDCLIMIKMLEKDPNSKSMAEKLNKLKITSSKETVNEEYISDAIKVDFSPEEGRFIRAARNVEVGDEILIENPNVCALLEKFCQSHCQNCFLRTVTPIPCNNCTDIIFCSEKCLKDATYHEYECGILPTFWKSGASINCHLALRIIACKPLEYFKKIKSEIDIDLDFEHLKKLPTNDYRRICNLVRHERKRNPSGFFQYTLMARFLSQLLHVSDYFGANPSKDDVLYITSLILRNLQFLQFNTHEISELHQATKMNASAKTVFIGGGIYPTLALFNHSCDPGIVRYFKGTKIYVNAIKDVESGLQISENYGPLYAQECREDRQVKLIDLYWFDCQCDACLENWPKYEDMKNDVIRFRCDADIKCNGIIEVPPDVNEFMIKCQKCGQLTNILKGLKVMQDTEQITKIAKRLYDAGDYCKALQKNIDLLKMMNKVLAPPFTDYLQVQQSIRDCYLNLGNAYALN